MKKKRLYFTPQIDVVNINTGLHLLAGSGQSLSSSGITVDDMDEVED